MASNSVDVYVKLPTGRSAVYYVSPTDTISTICKKIAGEEEIKETQVQLKYQGKLLNKTHSMSYLGVRPETILKAEIHVPRSVTLKLTLPDGRGNTELTSTSLDTIEDVTSRVAHLLEEEDARKVVLKFSGRVVRGTTVLDAGLIDGSALDVEIVDLHSTNPVDEAAKNETAEIDENKKQAILHSFVTYGRPVEVVFSFDTTGSMYACLDEVRSKLADCCTRLIQDIPYIRIGIIAHGDYCDAQSSYVIRILDMTSDTQALVDFAQNVPKTGGGDAPECYEWVLRKAQTLDWSENSAKALVVIGDDLPHDSSFTDQHVFWRDELDVLKGMDVKVYGVQARADSGTNRYFYEELAEASGGHYLKLGHFDIITDMFLAVCYRESQENASEALEAFAKEVEEAGRMTDERRHMFKQLENNKSPTLNDSNSKNTNNHNPRESRRYVEAPWWDNTLVQESATFQYCYNAETDTFTPASWRNTRNPDRFVPTAAPGPLLGSSDTATRKSRKRGKGSRRCSVM